MKKVYIIYLTSKTMNEILGVYVSKESAEECLRKFHPQSGSSGREYHIIEKKIIYSLYDEENNEGW
jgi:hypothetical protein